MMTEATEKNGIITIRPHKKGDRFPKFNEIEQQKNGHVIGWSGALLKNIETTFLCIEKRPIKALSMSEDEVRLQII